MKSFSKQGLKLIINDKSVYCYYNHPNMGTVQVFKLDGKSKFTTELRAGEKHVRKMITERAIELDVRLKDSTVFTKWWNSK